eukprot:TRINITY_DN2471_c0_g1_i10.p1 TRINITY_DN2471_c0_g1~~TRINITY_DN2471_c0_g1_i10.p1  ORF type:complete len:125 (+),score=20.47 TRINITY_DN2471_c0_g1_i10:49-423(+)
MCIRDRFKAMKEHIERFCTSDGKQREIREKVVESWIKVRDLLSGLVVNEKKLKWELKKITKFVNKGMVPMFDATLFALAKKFMPILALRPEMVNYCESVLKKLDKEVEEEMLKEEATYICGHDN